MTECLYTWRHTDWWTW